MAEGFFKSSAQLMNNLASTLGRRSTAHGAATESQLPHGEHAFQPALSDYPPPVPSALRNVSGIAPAMPSQAGNQVEINVEFGHEPDTGIREAVDAPAPVTVAAAHVNAHTRQTVPAGTNAMRAPNMPPHVSEPAPRHSGFQAITVQDVRSSEQTVRAANLEFEDRVGDRLELPLGVLLNQRDRALRELFDVRAQAEQRIHELASDHDRFVAFLMQEHLERTQALESVLTAERERAAHAEAMVQPVPSVAFASDAPEARLYASDLADMQSEIIELRSQLAAMTSEMDETQADAVRLQGERDDAIRATDDVRLELQGEIDAARDEAIELQARLDQAERALSDAQDQARDEVETLHEQIADLQRQMNAEA